MKVSPSVNVEPRCSVKQSTYNSVAVDARVSGMAHPGRLSTASARGREGGRRPDRHTDAKSTDARTNGLAHTEREKAAVA